MFSGTKTKTTRPRKRLAASDSEQYRRHKEIMRLRQAAISAAGREIGPLRAVKDEARKAAATASLQAFADAYFPQRFFLPWSDDQRRVIARMDSIIRHGGLSAIAMPRGSGKSSIAEVACLWAVFTGLRKFVMLISASERLALRSMQKIKQEIERNDLLLDDWPEVCDPIRRLDGKTNLARGQLLNGRSTHLAWRKDEIVLPWIPGSAAAGALLTVAGLTGHIRGTAFSRPDGSLVRPDFVIPDDPQTDESARSLSQSEQRERIIEGTILGLAGPGKKIAAVMPCTVIRPGDLADTLLNRERHPEWQSERTKMLYSFPTATALWDEYRERRDDELRNNGDGSACTTFYRDHQAEMDEGAQAAWAARYNEGEASAIQSAMNLLFRNEAVFWAEYQNQPQHELSHGQQLRPEDIDGRVSGLDRGQVPLAAVRLTAGIDVQQKVLYYVVVAWSDDFTGSIIDYGSFPDQKRKFFVLADVQRTLARTFPGSGVEGSIHAGLGRLADELLGREWKREDGAGLRIERVLVDAGFQTATIKSWCRSSPHAALVMPYHGKGVGAKSKPWAQYTKRPGERLGTHWLIAAPVGKSRHVTVDSNYWKSFVAERLRVPLGSKGCLTLYGREGQDHRMLAQQLCSEYSVRLTHEGTGHTVDEWSLRVERPDNHLWDCLTAATAAASMGGSALLSQREAAQPKRAGATRQDADRKRAAFQRRRGF